LRNLEIKRVCEDEKESIVENMWMSRIDIYRLK